MEYDAFLHDQAASIDSFKQVRQQAFANELANWHATGQFNFEAPEADATQSEQSWPADALVVDSPVSGSVWQLEVTQGQTVAAGQLLVVLESMKMEIPIVAPKAGVVLEVLPSNGSRVNAGQALVVIEEAAD